MTIPKISSYRFGEIIIEGKKHNKDVIIFPDRINTTWWRETGHSLSTHDLNEVIQSQPEILIVGTGSFGRMKVPQKTKKFLEAQGIKVVIRKTKEAIQVYNQLHQEIPTVLRIWFFAQRSRQSALRSS